MRIKKPLPPSSYGYTAAVALLSRTKDNTGSGLVATWCPSSTTAIFSHQHQQRRFFGNDFRAEATYSGVSSDIHSDKLRKSSSVADTDSFVYGSGLMGPTTDDDDGGGGGIPLTLRLSNIIEGGREEPSSSGSSSTSSNTLPSHPSCSHQKDVRTPTSEAKPSRFVNKINNHRHEHGGGGNACAGVHVACGLSPSSPQQNHNSLQQQQGISPNNALLPVPLLSSSSSLSPLNTRQTEGSNSAPLNHQQVFESILSQYDPASFALGFFDSCDIIWALLTCKVHTVVSDGSSSSSSRDDCADDDYDDNVICNGDDVNAPTHTTFAPLLDHLIRVEWCARDLQFAETECTAKTATAKKQQLFLLHRRYHTKGKASGKGRKKIFLRKHRHREDQVHGLCRAKKDSSVSATTTTTTTMNAPLSAKAVLSPRFHFSKQKSKDHYYHPKVTSSHSPSSSSISVSSNLLSRTLEQWLQNPLSLFARSMTHEAALAVTREERREYRRMKLGLSSSSASTSNDPNVQRVRGEEDETKCAMTGVAKSKICGDPLDEERSRKETLVEDANYLTNDWESEGLESSLSTLGHGQQGSNSRPKTADDLLDEITKNVDFSERRVNTAHSRFAQCFGEGRASAAMAVMRGLLDDYDWEESSGRPARELSSAKQQIATTGTQEGGSVFSSRFLKQLARILPSAEDFKSHPSSPLTCPTPTSSFCPPPPPPHMLSVWVPLLRQSALYTIHDTIVGESLGPILRGILNGSITAPRRLSLTILDDDDEEEEKKERHKKGTHRSNSKRGNDQKSKSDVLMAAQTALFPASWSYPRRCAALGEMLVAVASEVGCVPFAVLGHQLIEFGRSANTTATSISMMSGPAMGGAHNRSQRASFSPHHSSSFSSPSASSLISLNEIIADYCPEVASLSSSSPTSKANFSGESSSSVLTPPSHRRPPPPPSFHVVRALNKVIHNDAKRRLDWSLRHHSGALGKTALRWLKEYYPTITRSGVPVEVYHLPASAAIKSDEKYPREKAQEKEGVRSRDGGNKKGEEKQRKKKVTTAATPIFEKEGTASMTDTALSPMSPLATIEATTMRASSKKTKLTRITDISIGGNDSGTFPLFSSKRRRAHLRLKKKRLLSAFLSSQQNLRRSLYRPGHKDGDGEGEGEEDAQHQITTGNNGAKGAAEERKILKKNNVQKMNKSEEQRRVLKKVALRLKSAKPSDYSSPLSLAVTSYFRALPYRYGDAAAALKKATRRQCKKDIVAGVDNEKEIGSGGELGTLFSTSSSASHSEEEKQKVDDRHRISTDLLPVEQKAKILGYLHSSRGESSKNYCPKQLKQLVGGAGKPQDSRFDDREIVIKMKIDANENKKVEKGNKTDSSSSSVSKTHLSKEESEAQELLTSIRNRSKIPPLAPLPSSLDNDNNKQQPHHKQEDSQVFVASVRARYGSSLTPQQISFVARVARELGGVARTDTDTDGRGGGGGGHSEYMSEPNADEENENEKDYDGSEEEQEVDEHRGKRLLGQEQFKNLFGVTAQPFGEDQDECEEERREGEQEDGGSSTPSSSVKGLLLHMRQRKKDRDTTPVAPNVLDSSFEDLAPLTHHRHFDDYNYYTGGVKKGLKTLNKTTSSGSLMASLSGRKSTASVKRRRPKETDGVDTNDPTNDENDEHALKLQMKIKDRQIAKLRGTLSAAEASRKKKSIFSQLRGNASDTKLQNESGFARVSRIASGSHNHMSQTTSSSISSSSRPPSPRFTLPNRGEEPSASPLFGGLAKRISDDTRQRRQELHSSKILASHSSRGKKEEEINNNSLKQSKDIISRKVIIKRDITKGTSSKEETPSPSIPRFRYDPLTGMGTGLIL